MPLSKKQEDALKKILSSSAKYVIGIDEVGKGALAGPVVVGVVVADKGWGHPQVKDSKKYSKGKGKTAHEKRQEVLNNVILPAIKHQQVWELSHTEIDTKGIEEATIELTMMAARAASLLYSDSIVVYDGDWAMSVKHVSDWASMPKADDLVAAVSAASIVAKVHRDKHMINMCKKYPVYGFSSHMGYGTAQHMQALTKYGPCEIHRRSYGQIRNLEQYFASLSVWQANPSGTPDSTS